MTDFPFGRDAAQSSADFRVDLRRIVLPAILILLAGAVLIGLIMRFGGLSVDAPLLVDSTLGDLALWMIAQAEEDAPELLLGQYAKAWAAHTESGVLDSTTLLETMQSVLVGTVTIGACLAGAGLVGLLLHQMWCRALLTMALAITALLFFIVPTLENENTLMLVLLACFLLIGACLFAPGRAVRWQSFILVLTIILLVWEVGKVAAAAINYRIILPADAWSYSTYPTLEDALESLQRGEMDALLAERNVVRDLMAESPVSADIDPQTLTYPNLRYLTNVTTGQTVMGLFPIEPAFPGRLSVVVPAEDALEIRELSALRTLRLGAVAGDFADERYLAVPREVVLIDLKFLNDVNLPHLQNIAEALLQPARRNGPLLLIRILSNAALHTWSEAILGFVFGGTLGFLLGTLFAHFAPLERGLLPYVVASQTVPILAIAPMVVIWLGAGPQAVAVISAYLTFFPVTINTLRGLRSPHPNAMELMDSYAASRWEIMWKLRFPAALPYIFTALKVSATASVVGAIIGELPSSIREGLGRAILDFSSDYSLVSTPKLWGSILVAASVGILSFLIVSLVEYLVLGRYIRN